MDNNLTIQARDQIMDLAMAMKSLPQVELPVEHFFAPGVCARQMFIPKGTVAVGKIHKYEHLNILLKGKASFVTADNGLQHIEAPFTFVSKAGVQKAVLAHEDMLLMCILLTNETDPEKIEAEFTVDNYQDLLEYEKCITLDM